MNTNKDENNSQTNEQNDSRSEGKLTDLQVTDAQGDEIKGGMHPANCGCDIHR
jgi:hypothetical protein